jgi:hypothetical protein
MQRDSRLSVLVQDTLSAVLRTDPTRSLQRLALPNRRSCEWSHHLSRSRTRTTNPGQAHPCPLLPIFKDAPSLESTWALLLLSLLDSPPTCYIV